MFSTRKMVICLPLLLVSGVAGQLAYNTYSSKVTGDLVSANWNSGPDGGSVMVLPVDVPDPRAYLVSWGACSLNPDWDHRVCMYAGGLAPRSAIKAQEVGSLGLDLDVSILSVVFSNSGIDCTSGTCQPFVPPSVPLRGTFTVYRGPGSFTEEINGSTRRESIMPFGGSTLQASTGSRTQYSATFVGTVGPVTVVPPPSGSNASLSIMKGQQSSQTVYPVYPAAP